MSRIRSLCWNCSSYSTVKFGKNYRIFLISLVPELLRNFSRTNFSRVHVYGPGNYLSRSSCPSLLLTLRVSGLPRFTALQSSCSMTRTGSKGECTVAVRSLLSLSRMKNYVEFVVLIRFFAKTAR